MLKHKYLLSILVAFALIAAACGTSATSTESSSAIETPASTEVSNLPEATQPLATSVMTETVETPTEEVVTPTEMIQATDTPVATKSVPTPTTESLSQTITGTLPLPPTGFVDLSRVSNLLNLSVYDQNNEKLGEVKDLILDLAAGKTAYVVVGAEDKLVPVPWQVFTVEIPQAGSSSSTGPQNALVLKVDRSVFDGAPSFSTSEFPDTQTPGWDSAIQSYWKQYITQ